MRNAASSAFDSVSVRIFRQHRFHQDAGTLDIGRLLALERPRHLHQQLLIPVVVDDVAESLDRWFGGAKHWDRGVLQKLARVPDMVVAHPAGDEGFAAFLANRDYRLRHRDGIRHDLGRVNDHQAVDVGILYARADRGCVAVPAGILMDVDRIVHRVVLRQHSLDGLNGSGRQIHDADALIDRPIGGDHTRTPAVGHDREPVAARLVAGR
jgi:hypothetical protein